MCTLFIILYLEITNLHFKSTVHVKISGMFRLVKHQLLQQFQHLANLYNHLWENMFSMFLPMAFKGGPERLMSPLWKVLQIPRLKEINKTQPQIKCHYLHKAVMHPEMYCGHHYEFESNTLQRRPKLR